MISLLLLGDGNAAICNMFIMIVIELVATKMSIQLLKMPAKFEQLIF